MPRSIGSTICRRNNHEVMVLGRVFFRSCGILLDTFASGQHLGDGVPGLKGNLGLMGGNVGLPESAFARSLSGVCGYYNIYIYIYFQKLTRDPFVVGIPTQAYLASAPESGIPSPPSLERLPAPFAMTIPSPSFAISISSNRLFTEPSLDARATMQKPHTTDPPTTVSHVLADQESVFPNHHHHHYVPARIRMTLL